MSSIDYMKILNIAAFSLGASSDFDFKALDLKIFSAYLTMSDNSHLKVIIKVYDYHAELFIEKNLLETGKFTKWLPQFEFYLEQNFLKNISIDHSETDIEYIVSIKF